MATIRFTLLWIGILILTGCGGGGGGFTGTDDSSGSGGGSQLISTIDFSTGAESVRADGESSVALRVGLTDIDGNAAVGRAVAFTTTAGNLSSDSARSDANGVAEVRLIAPTRIGSAVVIASIDGIIQSTVIGFVAGKPVQIKVNAIPKTVNPNATTRIQAQVLDAFDNPVVGELVSFNPPVLGSLDATSATTNVDGFASVTYTAGSEIGTETIQASLSNETTGLTQIVISTIATIIENLTLTSGTKNLVADGMQRVVLRATVTDINDQPARGLSVNFATTAGTLQDVLGNIQNWAVTDNSGIATLYLLAPKQTGSAVITAAVNGFNTTIPINFVSGPAQKITNGLTNLAGNLNAAPASLRPKGVTTIQAMILDANNNPVIGEAVSFSITTNNSGGVLSAVSAISDVNGRVTATYTAGAATGTDSIIARLTNGVSGTANITVNNDATVVAELTLITGSESIIANGENSVMIRATVTDSEKNPAVGTEVNFSTTAGAILTNKVLTTGSGIAETRLTAPKYIGIATITAEAAGFSATATVTFKAGPPNQLTINSTPATIRPKGTSTLQAIARDQFDNPVVGETIIFTMTENASEGELGSSSATTNADGQASVIYTAGEKVGNVSFQARLNNGTTATNSLEVTTSGVTTIGVTLGSDSIVADGESSVAVRATVTDIDGNPEAGTAVKFTTTAGTLSANSSETNSFGIAEVFLKSPKHIGAATVTASISGFNKTATIDFIAGAPRKITLTSTLLKINPKSKTDIQATVLDENDNPVEDQTVNFDFSLNQSQASLSRAFEITDEDGRATITYTAGNSAGDDIIRARLSNGTVQTIKIQVAATGIVAKLSLATSQISVKSDNSDSATITAIALDNNNVVVAGVTVNFITSAGQLSAGSLVTDANGKVSVNFSSGNDASNAAPALITASVAGIENLNPNPSIPILIAGTTLTLDASTSNLEINKPVDLTVTIRNAAGNPIPGVKINLITVTSDTATIKPKDATATSFDSNGQLIYTLTPKSGTEIKVTAEGLGAVAEKEFVVSEAGEAFQITEPKKDPATLGINESLEIRVNAGKADNITLVTSLGNWPNESNLYSVATTPDSENPNLKVATAKLTSTESGTATIRVFDTNDVEQFDIITVLIAAPQYLTDHVVLQSNVSTLLPSVGGAIRSAELTATVYTANNEPVANAPVVFSLSNTTSSGEKLNPIYGLTDTSGKVKSQFTSGSLSAAPGGVNITATVYDELSNPIHSDTIQININQTAGSVVIGASTQDDFKEDNNGTSYILPLTVLVTDSAGASVPNATVSLTAWPISYSTGTWLSSNCILLITETLDNEDINENVILDPGEDFNLDGVLTPPNSAAGAIPATVTTNADGLSNFNLTYLKKYAIWITTRIRAKTLVLGSETVGELLLDPLPVTIGDEEACFVFDSPFTN